MSTLSDKIRKLMTKAIADYSLIKEGDRVLSAVSGGKDSAIMALLLNEVQKRAPFYFEHECIILDQKQPGFAPKSFLEWCSLRGIKITLISEDTHTIVKEKVEEGKSFCGLCSRLRRGILYNYADANGFTKIALGHHRNDLNETLLMNLFFSGSLCSMPPKLHSKDGRNTVIRPMALVDEKDLMELENELEIPVIPCNLCGSQDGLKRARIKKLLTDLESEIPNLAPSIQAGMTNVKSTHLMDHRLFDFANK